MLRTWIFGATHRRTGMSTRRNSGKSTSLGALEKISSWVRHGDDEDAPRRCGRVSAFDPARLPTLERRGKRHSSPPSAGSVSHEGRAQRTPFAREQFAAIGRSASHQVGQSCEGSIHRYGRACPGHPRLAIRRTPKSGARHRRHDRLGESASRWLKQARSVTGLRFRLLR